MIKNYFKIAIRSLFKNRTYSLINVLGLTFGLTCFMLIGLYLFDELTFDRQHKNAERIYRVIGHKKTNNEDLTIAAASFMLAEEAKKTIPEIENTARFTRTGRANMKNPENKNTFYQTVTVANNGFMELFDFDVVAGNPKTALKEPNSIVITENLAKLLFNRNDVVGKLVQWEFMETPLKITAVIKNHPRNSSFDFESVYSEGTFLSDTGFARRAYRDWASENYSVFVLLKDKADPSQVSNKINQLIQSNYTPDAGSSISYSLQSLKDIHLRSKGIVDGARNSNVEATSNGSLFYIKIFGLVALFILFIACINYMNLSTARSTLRAKEIGIRKVLGASTPNVIYILAKDFLILVMIAFVVAVPFAWWIMHSWLQEFAYRINIGLWIFLIAGAIAIVIALLTVSFLAIKAAVANPVKSLRTE